MQEQLDWGMASALAIILLIVTLMMFVVFQRYFGFDKIFSGQDTGEPLRQGKEYNKVQRSVFVISSIFIAIFLIAPILVILPMSISESPFIKFPPDALTFEWFKNLYYDPKWTRALTTSLKIAAIAVSLSLMLGTSAALGLSRMQSKLRPLLEAFVLTPLIIPPIIIAVGLYSLYAPLGFLGSKLGLGIGHALLATPFVFIAVRASLLTFDQNIELAAIGLGASWITMAHRVMLPSIWPGLLAGSIFAFITSFDDVILALFLTDVRSRTLPRVIYEGVKYDTDPTIVALAAILIFISMTVLITNLILERRK